MSSAALNNVFTALVDMSRRITGLEAARTVIDPASLDGTQLAPDSVTASHIVAGSVHASEIETGNIVASIMTVGAVNASHIDASSIRASVLDAAVLTAGNAFITSLRASILDAGILTATNATIGTLRASIINSAQIIAQGLQAQVLQAVQGAITDLSSVSSNTGTLTASLIKTANSPNARIEIGTTAGGIKGYNSSNALTFGFDVTTGAATVGSITVTGAAGTQVPSSTLTGFIGGGNLAVNSSFESTDPAMPGALWTNNGTTNSVVTTQAFHGSKSLRVNYVSSTNPRVDSDLVAQHGVPITSMRSRPMVTSVWVWVDTTATTLAAGATDASLMVFDGTTQPSAQISTLTKGQWNRVSVKHTPAAGATSVVVRLYNPYTNGPVFYDGLQSEFGDAMTAYNPKADEIIYGSITTVELAAGAVKATNIDAGAITADKISLGVPNAVSIRNGQYSEGNPTIGSTVANGWSTFTTGGTPTYTIQTDPSFPRTVRHVNATSVSSIVYQSLTLPIGRYIFRGWAKTTSVAGAAGAGATIYVEFTGTGAGTITYPTPLQGTNAWTLLEVVVNVTTAGTVQFESMLGLAGGATGTAEFANLHLIPPVTGTTLTPNAVTTLIVTGGTIQTATSGARNVLDSAGLRFIDSAAVTTVDLSATAGGLTILATAVDTPPDSRKLRLLHSSGGATAGEFFAFSNNTATPTLSNGTFDVDLSGWTASASSGTITRDTTTTQAGAGSLNMTIAGALSSPDHIYTTLTGTFKAGLTYRIPFYARGAPRTPGSSNEYVALWTTTARTTLIQRQYINMVSGSWTRNIIEYRPTADTTNPVLEFNHSTVGPDTIYFDTVGPVEVPSSTVISSLAKTGAFDVGQIMLNVSDASSVKTAALLLSSEGRSDFVRAYQTSPKTMTRVPWTANGWVTYGNNYLWKDQLGFVHIIGEIQNTSGSTKAANALIFTLPSSDYYPTFRFYFPCTANDGTVKIVEIASTGNVTLGDNGPTVVSTPATGSHINLGHIVYPTADAVL